MKQYMCLTEPCVPDSTARLFSQHDKQLSCGAEPGNDDTIIDRKVWQL